MRKHTSSDIADMKSTHHGRRFQIAQLLKWYGDCVDVTRFCVVILMSVQLTMQLEVLEIPVSDNDEHATRERVVLDPSAMDNPA